MRAIRSCSNFTHNMMILIDKIVINRSSFDGLYFENLDGLRAVAALMVMSMHVKTFPSLAGGAPGVWIFFALSGYLLYSGFLKSADKLSTRVIFSYLSRRIFRILPLYLVFAFVYAYLFKNWPPEQEHRFFLVQLFFLKNTMHLWTIKTEMVLYLLLPFIMLLLFFIKNNTAKWLFLVSLAITNMVLFEYYKFSIAGTKNHLAIFILGMAAVHLSAYVSSRLAPWLAYAAFGLILMLSTFSPWTQPLREALGVVNRPDMYGYAWVFYPLCILLLVSLNRFKSRFWGNTWLRIIGVCGYGFYLWHPMVVEMVRGWELEWFWYQCCCYLLNIALSITTYLLIEQPGIRFGRTISIWIRENRSLLFGIRPWAVCLMIIVLFCSYRQYFFLDKKMSIEITIKAPHDTVTQFFFSNNDKFYESKSAGTAIKGGEWQTVKIPFKEIGFDTIRFDPGTKPGNYEIRDLRLYYPRSKHPVPLDIAAFSGANQISSLHTIDNTFLITTDEQADDPVLIYNKAIPPNFMSSHKITLYLFIAVFVVFCLGFLLMDRICARVLEKRSIELASTY